MTTHTNGVRRIFGVPMSFSGLTDANARLRAFEPENPNFFVPRTVGIGWDINIGAIAVRLGLLRPDDSVPDLADHIPAATINALRISPLVGGAAVTIAGVRAARQHQTMPTNWGLTFRPTRWGSGAAAMAVPVLLSTGAGVWAEVAARRSSSAQAGPSADVTASAQALGLQAMSLVLIAAAARQAQDPKSARLLPIVGIAAAPAVTTGVLVSTVRSALRGLEQTLRRKRTEKNRSTT